jgi:GntR family transcriptional repressor for pyruvate dehydrogenase complex
MELQPVTRTSSVELCARSLRDAVLRGTYPAGDRLPPERQLATTLGVNRVTVRGALAELVKEGLLSVRQGSGYEVREALSSGGIELLPSLAAHFDRRANVEAVRDLLAVSRAIAGVVLERLSHHRPSRAGVTAISKAIDVLEAMLPKPQIADFARADLDVLRAVVSTTGSAALQLLINPIGDVLLAMPGLQAAMFRAPEENVFGWRALVGWLESPTAGHAPLLEVLSALDDATLRFYRRHP